MRVIALLILVLLLGLPKLWNEAKGVCARQLFKERLSEEQAPMGEEVQEILDQPFTYWKKGSQAYVFLSRDGQYVLKIPRLSKMGGSFFRNRDHRKEEVLKSFQIASLALSKQTATIYAQYGQSSHQIEGQLFDRLGRQIHVPLDQVPFALQEKKTLLSQKITKENAKELLSAWIDLVEAEKKAGYCATDCAFLLNVSYDQGIAQRIDIGSYQPISKFSWHKVSKPIRRYLKEFDPSLLSWFKEEIQIRSCGGEHFM